MKIEQRLSLKYKGRREVILKSITSYSNTFYTSYLYYDMHVSVFIH